MNQPKILVVDDEPFNIDYLEQELEDSGCRLISAQNGQEALDRVFSESPDLVLLDIMMPVMDGFEVLSRLKADPSTRDIPVIIISAANDLQSMVKGIQLGAEDYLPKPFEPTLLHARIASGLEKKRLHDLEALYLKSLEREMEIARDIQQGFLPSELPRVEGLEIAAYFKAAREVAGDFYDAFLLPDGNLVFVVRDVCGKGVGAALFMTLFRSLIRASATTREFSTNQVRPASTPGECLQQAITFTNHYIAETHAEANMFATVFIGSLDSSTGHMVYLNCGNESALLVKPGGELLGLRPTGPAVGVIPDAEFKLGEAVLERGGRLLAFTDGIPDSLNEQGESFGYERIHALLCQANLTATGLCQALEADLLGFIGSAEQFDDITLLTLQRLA